MSTAKAVVIFLYGAFQASLIWATIVFPLRAGIASSAVAQPGDWMMVFPILLFFSIVFDVFLFIRWAMDTWDK